MNKIINKISKALQVLLTAPINLPVKVLNAVKYIALGLGLIESVMTEDDRDAGHANKPDDVDRMNHSTAPVVDSQLSDLQEDRLKGEGGADETQ